MGTPRRDPGNEVEGTEGGGVGECGSGWRWGVMGVCTYLGHKRLENKSFLE